MDQKLIKNFAYATKCVCIIWYWAASAYIKCVRKDMLTLLNIWPNGIYMQHMCLHFVKAGICDRRKLGTNFIAFISVIVVRIRIVVVGIVVAVTVVFVVTIIIIIDVLHNIKHTKTG